MTGFLKWTGDATSISSWAEARDAVKQSTVPRTAPATKKNLA